MIKKVNGINILITEESKTLILSRSVASQHHILSTRMFVRIGAFLYEMTVKIDDSFPENTIGLPKELKAFTFPQHLSYEMVVKERSILIGPIIAFVAYRYKKSITTRKLEFFRKRFSQYKKIGGLLFICAADGIKPQTKTIEGYYYNPAGTSPQTRWVYGNFPYPNAVYKRKPIDSERYHDLISHIGDRVINSVFFLKADVAQMIERDQDFQKYFPYTELLKSARQLTELLGRFGSLYLKPNNGKQGGGIYKVTMSDNGVLHFLNRKRQQKNYKIDEKFDAFLQKCKKRKYIVQQAILSPHLFQPVDFRVYVQKNDQKEWVCQGMIARQGKGGTIVNNLQFTARLGIGCKAIKQWFGIEEKRAREIEQRIYDTCIAVCKELDKKIGNYGDVAVDVIVDEDFRPFVLEINKDFGYESVRRLKQSKLLHKLFTTPFQYAKALGGFSEEKESFKTDCNFGPN